MQIGDDRHTGKFVAVDGDSRHLILQQKVLQNNCAVFVAKLKRTLELDNFLIADCHQFLDFCEQYIDIFHVPWGNCKPVGGFIPCKQNSVTIIDMAARGRNGHNLHSIVPRQRDIIPMGDQLKIDQAPNKNQKQYRENRK